MRSWKRGWCHFALLTRTIALIVAALFLATPLAADPIEAPFSSQPADETATDTLIRQNANT